MRLEQTNWRGGLDDSSCLKVETVHKSNEKRDGAERSLSWRGKNLEGSRQEEMELPGCLVARVPCSYQPMAHSHTNNLGNSARRGEYP